MKFAKYTVAAALALVGVCAQAAVTTIPTSSATPSNGLYTNAIGGGVGNTVLGRNDDASTGRINLGFNFDFFGTTYSSIFVNNNGNISFNAPIAAFTATGPQGVASPMISPFFGDVDTRFGNSGVVTMRTDVANQVVITWNQVGNYNAGNGPTGYNTFQLVLRGADYDTPVGEGAIGFFYGNMGWEKAISAVAKPGAIGFGDGAGNGEVLEGSIKPGIAAAVANKKIWFDANLGVIDNNPDPEPAPDTNTVPEPASLILVGLGLASLTVIRKKKQAP